MEIKKELNRKEREKLLRKSEIADAATVLFAKNGYDSTTLDEIASKSQFGKGTIYNYFNSKEEIYDYIIEEIFKSHLEILITADKESKTFRELVERITYDILEFCIYYSDKFQLLVNVRTNKFKFGSKRCSDACLRFDNEIYEIYKKRILLGITNKEIIDINPDTLVLFYPSFIFPYVISLLTIKSIENINLNDEVKFLVKVLFDGIAAK
ncbi:MAG TPA: TetR/AcrR family transcriptional regulator [Melioribacteraceae bacterium]|nr:TetR/AcrR family transcriptional regulator [Melioribacteraceae bacterium]